MQPNAKHLSSWKPANQLLASLQELILAATIGVLVLPPTGFAQEIPLPFISSVLDEMPEPLATAPREGDLDTSFSGDGKLVTSIGDRSLDQASAVAIQPDGKIVVAGTVGSRDIAMFRFLPNGDPDMSFSGDGKLRTNIGTSDFGNAMVLQSDGKIVVVGMSSGDFLVVRFHLMAGSMTALMGRVG
jgi:uncharacterized delta-60 repeat protein